MSVTATNIIQTEMDLRANQFVAGAKQANAAIDRLTRGNLTAGGIVDGLRSKLANLGGGAAIGAAAIVGVGVALAATVAKAARFGEELQVLSNRTGESVEALSRLKFAAEQEDVSLGQVAQGLRIASQRAVEAARGNKDAADSFKRLGIDIRDANGNLKTGTELLEDIGEGLAKLPPGTERTAAAVELLGRSGTALVPLVTNLAALNQRAEELGLTVGPGFARSADEFGDRMAELRSVTGRFGVAIAEALLPTINDLIESLVNSLIPALDFFKEKMSDLGFTLFRAGKLFDFVTAGAVAFGAKLSGDEATLAGARDLMAEYAGSLRSTKDEWQALQNAESPAVKIGETGETAGEAKTQLQLLNEQMAKFAEGPAEIQGLVDFFGRFADALDAGNVQLKGLLDNIAKVAETSPVAAAALAQIQDAQAGRLEEGVIAGIPQRPIPGAGEPLLPGGGQPIAQPGIIEDSATDAEALAAALLEADLNAGRMNTTLTRGQEILAGFSSFADGLTTALISAAEGGKTAFADFFKSLLKGLAAAIIRALILRAILSIFGGGVGGIGKLLSAATGAAGTLGFQDQESSMLGRASQARSFAAGLGGSQLAGAGGLPVPSVTVTPSVTVNQATPATWIEITDNQILPRLRTRQRRLNDDLR